MAQDMDEYFPRARHLTTSGAEAAVPCRVERR